MKIPFDADEFGTKLDDAQDELIRLRNSRASDHKEWERLNDKGWVISECRNILSRYGPAYLNGYLANKSGVRPGTNQGYELIRDYLRRYEL